MTTDSVRVPIRTCIGCRKRFPQEELMKLAFHEERICFDPDRKMSGRGAYICKSRTCFEIAVKKRAFSRALRKSGSGEDLEALREEMITFDFAE